MLSVCPVNAVRGSGATLALIFPRRDTLLRLVEADGGRVCVATESGRTHCAEGSEGDCVETSSLRKAAALKAGASSAERLSSITCTSSIQRPSTPRICAQQLTSTTHLRARGARRARNRMEEKGGRE
jgi:hypothetical protein